MDNERYLLSTSDNPYNPWTSFDQWRIWDEAAGYNSLAYLARIVKSSDELSAVDQSTAISQGMNDIIEQNGDFYIKVPCPVDATLPQ